MKDKKAKELRRGLRDISLHILISVLCAVIIYWLFHSVKMAMLCLLVGIFIDLDHLIDYFMYFGLRFRLIEFFTSLFLRSGKVYLFLHSWELLVPIWLWGIYFKQEILALAITLGFVAHLLLDQCRRTIPFAYFLSFRIFNNFKAEKIVPEMLKGIKG